jgi:hypothetical protein
MCDFSDLLMQYANTLPGKNLLFRVSKKCGYSQLIALPRMQFSNQITVSDLLHTIEEQMGDYTVGKIYYYPKSPLTDSFLPSATTSPIYLTHSTAMREPLAQFALMNLPTAYSVDQCKYAVYQLYIDTDCHEAACDCSRPLLSLSRPEDPQIALPMSIDNEPTREEILSLLYDDLPPNPPPSPSNSLTSNPAHPLPYSTLPARTSPASASGCGSGLVTPWG